VSQLFKIVILLYMCFAESPHAESKLISRPNMDAITIIEFSDPSRKVFDFGLGAQIDFIEHIILDEQTLVRIQLKIPLI